VRAKRGHGGEIMIGIPFRRSLTTIDSLRSKKPAAGAALLGERYFKDKNVRTQYARHIETLEQFEFWKPAGMGEYRPDRGLWAPQRKAIALAHAYLAAQSKFAPTRSTQREAALIKMPTGTGKTGVIATLACASPAVRRVLVLTPRTALVDQMI